MSGFQHAGVTKGTMVLLGLASLSVSLLDVKPYFHLQLVPHLTKYYQFYRILVHPFAFANSTDLLIGEVLLYQAGVQIERSFGSRKFASFLLISSILSTILSLGSIILLYPLFGINAIPAGPYGVIFSLLWQHYRTVPSLYSFSLLGLSLSNKAFTWLLALQLVLAHPPSSLLATLFGLLTGYLYRTDLLLLPPLPFVRRRALRPLKTYRIPLSIHLLLSRLFSPLVGNSQPPRRATRVLPGQIASDGAAATSALAEGQRASLRNLLSSRRGRGRGGGGAADGGRRDSLGVSLGASEAAPVAGGGTGTGAGEGGAGGRVGGGAGRARAAMGEWMSEITSTSAGSGTSRAPTEQEIAVLEGMFPNLGREVVVRALQRSDHNTALAVESLLQESIG